MRTGKLEGELDGHLVHLQTRGFLRLDQILYNSNGRSLTFVSLRSGAASWGPLRKIDINSLIT